MAACHGSMPAANVHHLMLAHNLVPFALGCCNTQSGCHCAVVAAVASPYPGNEAGRPALVRNVRRAQGRHERPLFDPNPVAVGERPAKKEHE